MKITPHLNRIIFSAGIVMLIGGFIDPLEGSLVIILGSILITLSLHLKKDSFSKGFLMASLLIVFGVFFMFYFSSLGGFGGNSQLSWWWGTLILPYPAGWLLSIVLLLVRFLKQKKARS